MELRITGYERIQERANRKSPTRARMQDRAASAAGMHGRGAAAPGILPWVRRRQLEPTASACRLGVLGP